MAGRRGRGGTRPGAPGKAPQLGDGELRDLKLRLGLHEQAASASDEPHHRRKPRLLSTGTPELADNLSGINAKVPDQEFTKAKVKSTGQWTKGEISASGRWAKDDQHADTAYKNDIVNKAKDLGWGEGSKYVPDGALSKDYAPADTVAALRQSITGLGNKIQNLNQRVQKLERGKK
jgi:hypothetical protein